jgi:hypothetical protein
MKLLAASAFALTMLMGIGGASACNWMDLALSAPEPAVTASDVTVKQMAVAYLKELAEEKRIA